MAETQPGDTATRTGTTREGAPLPAATRAARGPLRRAAPPQPQPQRQPQAVTSHRPAAVAAQRLDVTPGPLQNAARPQSHLPKALLALLCVCLGSLLFLWRIRSVDSYASMSLSKATSALGAVPASKPSAPPQPTAADAVVPERDQPVGEAEQAITVERAAPVSQGLRAEDLTRVLSEHQAELEHCLQEAVVTQMLSGAAKVEPFRLDVSLEISAAGRVARVAVAGRVPEDLSTCLRARMSVLQFPAAAAPTLFRYPLVLAPRIVGS